jgi:hypothetical protein
MPRSCAFCNQPGVTKEHVWPDWMRKQGVIPAGAGTHVVESSRSTRVFQAPLGDTQVRQVCGKCNSGWMSRLEAEAAPLLMPMFEGSAIALDGTSQDTLSKW